MRGEGRPMRACPVLKKLVDINFCEQLCVTCNEFKDNSKPHEFKFAIPVVER